MIKLVLTDLDDTLVPFGASCVTKHSREAIHTLLDAGLHFGPATGRLPADMTWMFDGDQRCYATGLFANGQVVRAEGETVHTVTIPAETLERVRAVLDETGGAGYLALYDPWILGEIAYITTKHDLLIANPPATYGKITSILAHVVDFPTTEGSPFAPAYIKANVQCCCPRHHMEWLRNLLCTEVPELDFLFPSAVAPVIDILPLGWNKGDAVCCLASAFGFSLEEVAVFGDSENDLAMMTAVPNSIAVANAVELVSQTAAWHIGPCSQGAVDDALYEISRAYEERRMPSFMSSNEESCPVVKDNVL